MASTCNLAAALLRNDAASHENPSMEWINPLLALAGPVPMPVVFARPGDGHREAVAGHAAQAP